MMEIRLKSTRLEPLFLCLCLLTGKILGQANRETVVTVREGSEAVLPCSIRPQRNIRQDDFEWKKDGQTEVFFYDKGQHYNNGLKGQDKQFKGRVSHFPDQLQLGDASIRIRDTKVSDSGTYTCDYSPDEPNRQRFNIKLVVVPVVTVEDGSEAVLPCFIRPERDIRQDVFDWKKVGQKVFFYDKGQHYNNGLTGQDEQFKGRVSHFPDQLQSGNASIVIRNTKLSDSGTYSCDYSPDQPNRQTFYIELVVCSDLTDRSEENIPGASQEPSVTILDHTRVKVQLQCQVLGVSPKPKVEWQDSSGNILPAKEPQVTERGGSYNIILNTTVTKTDRYRCVVTQEEICHQISAETSVYIHGPEPPAGFSPGWILAAVVVLYLIVVVAALLAVLYKKGCIKLSSKKGNKKSVATQTERDKEKIPSESDELMENHSTSAV